jgi:hypothetical protein
MLVIDRQDFAENRQKAPTRGNATVALRLEQRLRAAHMKGAGDEHDELVVQLRLARRRLIARLLRPAEPRSSPAHLLFECSEARQPEAGGKRRQSELPFLPLTVANGISNYDGPGNKGFSADVKIGA